VTEDQRPKKSALWKDSSLIERLNAADYPFFIYLIFTNLLNNMKIISV
jgi:hypothetical protein